MEKKGGVEEKMKTEAELKSLGRGYYDFHKFSKTVGSNTIDIDDNFLGSVDRTDRNKICVRKWYKRVIFHFLDICVTNAWVLSKNVNNNQADLFNFKLIIAICLIK